MTPRSTESEITSYEKEHPDMVREWRIKFLEGVLQIMSSPTAINQAVHDREAFKQGTAVIDLQTAFTEGVLSERGYDFKVAEQQSITIDPRVKWLDETVTSKSKLQPEQALVLDAVFTAAASDMMYLFKIASREITKEEATLTTPQNAISKNPARSDELMQQSFDIIQSASNFYLGLIKKLNDVGFQVTRVVSDSGDRIIFFPNKEFEKSVQRELTNQKTIKLLLEEKVDDAIIESQFKILTDSQKIEILEELNNEFKMMPYKEKSFLSRPSRLYTPEQEERIKVLQQAFQATLANLDPNKRKIKAIQDILQDKRGIVNHGHDFNSEIKSLVTAYRRLKL